MKKRSVAKACAAEKRLSLPWLAALSSSVPDPPLPQGSLRAAFGRLGRIHLAAGGIAGRGKAQAPGHARPSPFEPVADGRLLREGHILFQHPHPRNPKQYNGPPIRPGRIAAFS